LKINKKLLKELEAESISIIRDSYSKSVNPVMMYSIGKDSSVMLHLAKKAFYPSKVPFPFLHIDTTWKFREMIKFRSKVFLDKKLKLITYTHKEGLKLNPQKDNNYTDVAKTQALKTILDQKKFDVIFGGARRDEESSRSKERIVSIREENHIWNPKNQRPEIWNLFNFKKKIDQTFRVFPLSNWTELDVWSYIFEEKIEVVKLYFSKKRKCVEKNNEFYLIDDNRFIISKKDKIVEEKVRFRTLGCYPLTAGIRSSASNILQIIKENNSLNNSERSGRLIDNDKISSMEIRKKEGYF